MQTPIAIATAGPWQAIKTPPDSIEIYSDHGVFIASTPARESTKISDLANARLIAAAPELLAALEKLLAAPLFNGSNAAPLVAARAAIAKAKGA